MVVDYILLCCTSWQLQLYARVLCTDVNYAKRVLWESNILWCIILNHWWPNILCQQYLIFDWEFLWHLVFCLFICSPCGRVQFLWVNNIGLHTITNPFLVEFKTCSWHMFHVIYSLSVSTRGYIFSLFDIFWPTAFWWSNFGVQFLNNQHLLWYIYSCVQTQKYTR